MRISELAKRAELSTDTIRFYEKIGLLDQRHYTRDENNYRDYNDSAMRRLTLIVQGQAAGFKLAEMGEYLDAWEADTIPLNQKEAFFLMRLEQIDAQIEKLNQMRAYTEEKLAMVRERRCVEEGQVAEEKVIAS